MLLLYFPGFFFKKTQKNMKRKFELISHSDDEPEALTVISPESKNKRESKLRRILVVNLVIFTVFVIPMLAVTQLNHVAVLELFDKMIGERCNAKFWSPKNLTRLKLSLDDNLFGQHIAKGVIMSTLSKRWNRSG